MDSKVRDGAHRLCGAVESVGFFTESLGDEGYAAIETLLGRAADAKLVPKIKQRLR